MSSGRDGEMQIRLKVLGAAFGGRRLRAKYCNFARGLLAVVAIGVTNVDNVGTALILLGATVADSEAS